MILHSQLNRQSYPHHKLDRMEHVQIVLTNYDIVVAYCSVSCLQSKSLEA